MALRDACDGLEAHLLGEAHLHSASLTTLGGHEDDTIGTTHTVDGSGSRILQHGDALDRESIEEGEVTLHVIHDDQRRTSTTIHGTDTTDIHIGLTPSWLRLRLIGLHTRERRGEGILEHGDWVLLQLRTGHYGSSLGDKLAWLGSESHRCQVVILIVLLQGDVHLVFLHAYLDMLVLVTEVRDIEVIAWLHLDGKVAIRIGEGLTQCLIDVDDGTRNRLAIGINYFTMYGSTIIDCESS